jgi:Bacterial regulatory protein, Fis family
VRLDRTRAAKRLGLTRTQLYLRLQKDGIEKPSSGRKPVTRLIAAEVGLNPGGFRVSEC